jgi:MFS family permease
LPHSFSSQAAGLTGVSKIVKYSNSFGFAVAAATAAAGGISIANGLGHVALGGLSEYVGREMAMIWSYILTGVFLFLTVVAGAIHSETMFVITAILAILGFAVLSIPGCDRPILRGNGSRFELRDSLCNR